MAAQAFGNFASRLVNRYRELESELLIIDADESAAAIHRAVAMKWEGTPFAVLLEIPNAQAELMRMLGPQIVTQCPTNDERIVFFTKLKTGEFKINEKHIDSFADIDVPTSDRLSTIAQVAPAVVVRSQAERMRLSKRFPFLATRDVRVAAPADQSVPHFTSTRHEEIVVWAPGKHAYELAIFATALEDLLTPLTIVCREGSVPNSRARFLTPDDAAEVLSRAHVVVDTDFYDPGTAIAFAERGVVVVAVADTGANEYVDNLCTYDPADRGSILSAVLTALGRPVSRLRPGFPDVSKALRVTEFMAERTPLVSVVIPTYNRLDMLPEALASVERQSYPNLEILVVNDGGDSIEEIVARFPRAKALWRDHIPTKNPETGEPLFGGGSAMNVGMEAAKGEYVSFMADDDIIFPDHIARLSDALERSGKDFAHSDILNGYLRPAGTAKYEIYGYILRLNQAADPWGLLVYNFLGVLSIMFRRSALARTGLFEPDIPVTQDYEFWVRFQEHTDFVHVDRVTAFYIMRLDQTQVITRDAAWHEVGFRTTYKLHPRPNRPLIEQRRAQWLEQTKTTQHHRDVPAFEVAPAPYPLYVDPRVSIAETMR